MIYGLFQSIESLFCVCKVLSIEFAHSSHFVFELLAQRPQIGLEPVSKRCQSVVQSFGFAEGEVSVGLNFALDILEFGFQLLFGLNAFH